MRAALREVLEMFSMGPLDAAAKYGPDFDLHRAQTDAATKAWRLVDSPPPFEPDTQRQDGRKHKDILRRLRDHERHFTEQRRAELARDMREAMNTIMDLRALATKRAGTEDGKR